MDITKKYNQDVSDLIFCLEHVKETHSDTALQELNQLLHSLLNKYWTQLPEEKQSMTRLAREVNILEQWVNICARQVEVF